MRGIKNRTAIFLFGLLGLLATSGVLLGSTYVVQQSTLYNFRNTVELQDEFLSGAASSGTIGSLGWFITGGTTSSPTGESNAPGIVRRDTTAAINTVAGLLLSGTQTQLLTAQPYTALFRSRLNTNDANTEIRIGLASVCTVVATSGIYFEKLSADTNWFAVSNNAGVQTRTDTGVAVNTNFNILLIRKIAASIDFIINGGTPTTISTNLPTANIQPCEQITNTAAAAKTFDTDYFQIKVTGIAR
jgi:hypothetical protein